MDPSHNIQASSSSQQSDDTGNVSSSKEESAKRSKLRRASWRKCAPEKEKINNSMPPTLNSAGPKEEDVMQVMVESLEQLMLHFPHLDGPNVVLQHTPSGCAKTQSKAIAGSSMVSTSDISSSAPSIEDQLLLQSERQVTSPVFYREGSFGARQDHRQLVSHLLARQLSLPLLDADYMSEMLQQSGVFQHPSVTGGATRNFPACANANSCIGAKHFFRWEPQPSRDPVVFMSLMFPGEYAAFLQEELQPTAIRPCVACCITSLTAAVLADRMRRYQSMDNPLPPLIPADTPSPHSSSSSSSSSSTSTERANDLLVFGRQAPVRDIRQLFRNTVDREDGFYSHFTFTDPAATDIFIDPFVRLNQSRVHLERSSMTGRARLNIDALRFRTTTLPSIRIGQRMSSYLTVAANELVSHKQSVDTAVRKAQVEYAFPRRPKPVFSAVSSRFYSLGNLSDCEAAMIDDGLLSQRSLEAALLFDASRESGALPSSPEDLGWLKVASPWHIRIMQHLALRVAFCDVMDQSDPVVYLLSKVVSQRCNTRKFGSVALDQFKLSPSACSTMKALVLISLLGNYVHSKPSSRPTRSVRNCLYRLLMDQANEQAGEIWFTSFTASCSYAMEFCLRDQLVHQMHDDPAFEAHVGVMMPLHEYFTIVEKACCFIRGQLSVLLHLQAGVKRTMDELQLSLQPFHNAMLAISYRLPKTLDNVLSKLVSARNPNNPKSVTVSVIDSQQQAATVSREQLQRVEDAIAMRDIYSELEGLDEYFDAPQHTRSSDTPRLNSVLPQAAQMLGVDRYERLKWLAQRVVQSRRDCLPILVSLMPRFGIPIKTASAIYTIIHEFTAGCINTTSLPTHLLYIKRVNAVAYDMLHVIVDLIQHYSRIKLIRTLPAHITNGQLLATQDAFPQLKGSPYGLYDGNEFVWCSVCNGLYSMARSEKARGTSKLYRFGLRDAVVDYETDFLYCWQRRASHTPECNAVPLIRMGMFGILLAFEGRQYMLCPQPRCGMPMVLNTNTCKFTEYGPACCLCAKALVSHTSVDKQTLLEMAKSSHQCVVCMKPLKHPGSKFYYADGVYVCQRHNHTGYMNAIVEWHNSSEDEITPAQMKRILIDVHQKAKAARMERQKGLWRRQLASAKLARCSKTRR